MKMSFTKHALLAAIFCTGILLCADETATAPATADGAKTDVVSAKTYTADEQAVIDLVRKTYENMKNGSFSKNYTECSTEDYESVDAASGEAVGRAMEVKLAEALNSGDLPGLMKLVAEAKKRELPERALKAISELSKEDQAEIIAKMSQDIKDAGEKALASLVIVDVAVKGDTAALTATTAGTKGKLDKTVYEMVKKDGRWLIKKTTFSKIAAPEKK